VFGSFEITRRQRLVFNRALAAISKTYPTVPSVGRDEPEPAGRHDLDNRMPRLMRGDLSAILTAGTVTSPMKKSKS
jgi:hypothetical protein